MILVDPKTRQPLPALDKDVRFMERVKARPHWQPGWRSGFDRAEDGTIVRMWFAPCLDECCKP